MAELEGEIRQLGAMDRDAMLAAVTAPDTAKTAHQVHEEERTIRLQTAEVTSGGAAVDFDLPVYDFSSGSRETTETNFHLLSAAANSPVALVFGSYT